MRDEVWKALADPNRRRILDILAEGPKSTGSICVAIPDLDRCTVMKHLEVLVRCSLVLVERNGRVRTNYLNAAPLHEIVERWVSGHTARLAASAIRLKFIAESPNHEQ